MAKFQHMFLYGGVSTPNEREQRRLDLDKASDEGWTIVEATFTPGSVFYALLKRPVVGEKDGAK